MSKFVKELTEEVEQLEKKIEEKKVINLFFVRCKFLN